MKKYAAFIIVGLAHVTLTYSFTNYDDIKRGAGKVADELLFKSSIPARAAACVFIKDRDTAGRYVKHAQFYAKKSERSWINDNIIDHVGYPVVDTLVGLGMSKMSNNVKPIHAAAESMSEDNRKFIGNNVQLITSAAIVQGIRLEYDNKDGITQRDVTYFGKCCAAQVGCDVVDEFLVKPAVEAYVGDINSWTASIVRGLGNYVLAQIVINKVSKY